MNRQLRSLASLTVASIKMYVRNKRGLFMSLFIPIVLVSVFGLFGSANGKGAIKLNIDDQAHNALSQELVKTVTGVEVFTVSRMDPATALEQLGKGKLDLAVTIPKDFGTMDGHGKPVKSQLVAEYNEAQPQNGQSAGLILGQIVTGLNDGITKTPEILSVKTQGVKTSNLNAFDFLLPGIIGLSVMQLGIFTVAFAFISYKTTGALRRIQATPTHPVNFLLAQGVTRMLMGIVQVGLLLGLGIWLFNFHLAGSLLGFFAFTILGSMVFLMIGFAIAGYAKDENQATPVAQLVQFPMMFLSGTFFARDAFPGWLKTLTDFFPLTYLTDALRKIANEGAHVTQLGGDFLGLVVWGVVLFLVTLKVFRWE